MSALTGLSYAELASMFPSASAEYEFARQAFNSFVAYVTGWAMILANIVAAAAVSIGFGEYFGHFVDVDPRIAAGGLLVVLTLVAISGIQQSVVLAIVLVFMEVGGLILVIVAGAPHLGEQDLLAGGSVGSVLSAGALVFFAYIGFSEVVTLSEETEDAARTIPRALLIALGLSTLLYVLVGVAAVSALGGEALAASDRPLALVITAEWGGSAGDLVAAIVLASTANTALLVMIAGSRLIFGMARRGSLPALFAAVSPLSRTPHFASLAVLGVALLFVLPGEIDFAASATDLCVYVVFILVNLAVIVLRLRAPRAVRRFTAPGRLGPLPVTPTLGLATVVVLMASLRAEAWLVAAAALLPAVPSWLFIARQREHAD
jgi:APA family basic amino acid/polyamine antiporter